MGEEQIFDLTGPDILAAANDDLALSPYDVQISPIIPLSQISQRQPAVAGPGFLGAFRAFIETGGATWPAALKLSDLAGGDGISCLVNKAHLCGDPRPPHSMVARLFRIF